MDITYIGHSCFRLKTTAGLVITDPYHSSVGFDLPRVSADVVTVSHQHEDHNNTSAILGTVRRETPFIIDSPGEYEVGGISVFSLHSFHDDSGGEKRGSNLIISLILDDITVVHLGDLGHELKQTHLSELNGADILMCPIGGHFTLDPKKVSDIVTALEPSILIPMHYRTPEHNQETFSQLITLEEFLKDFGTQATKTDKLSITASQLPDDLEVVTLTKD